MDVNNDILEVISQRVAEKVIESIKPMLENMGSNTLLTREQLMKRLDISAATLWKWEKTGQIKRAFTIGKRAYYSLPCHENA